MVFFSLHNTVTYLRHLQITSETLKIYYYFLMELHWRTNINKRINVFYELSREQSSAMTAILQNATFTWRLYRLTPSGETTVSQRSVYERSANRKRVDNACVQPTLHDFWDATYYFHLRRHSYSASQNYRAVLQSLGGWKKRSSSSSSSQSKTDFKNPL